LYLNLKLVVSYLNIINILRSYINANVLQANMIFLCRISCSIKCQCVGCKNDKDQRILEVEYSSQNDGSSDESETSDNSVADFLLSDENGILDLFDTCSESEWIISYSPIIRTSAL